MNEVGIFNETEEEIKEIEELKPLMNFVLQKEKINHTECNIILVDNEKIRRINKEYRKIDRETDVISFALEDEKEMILAEEIRILGDIYISLPKAKSQAKQYNHSFKRELCFLSVHGLLHLLGYDHMKEEEEKVMFQKQEEYLNEYGIFR